MIRLVLPFLLATPALASDPGLAALVARIDAQGSAGMAAAYAACLAGQGDVEATAGLFTARGWERIDDDEIGMVELHSADAPYMVTVWVDAARCEVGSVRLGTEPALQALDDLARLAGVAPEPAEAPGGCAAFRLGGAQIRISATPIDPACTSATTSAVRFQFGGA